MNTPANAPITVSGPPPTTLRAPLGQVQARFDAERYNEQVHDKGNNARLDIAVPCPCAGATSGSALATCQSCGGLGRIVVERREIHALISGMNASRKQLTWSQQLVGTSSITLDSEEVVTTGDRLVNLSAMGEYTERLAKGVLLGGELLYYPTYEPLSVRHLLAFTNPREKLKPLSDKLGHYKIDAAGVLRVQLGPAGVDRDVQLSIRYRHHPTFEVIDLPRDQVYSPAPANNPRQEFGAVERLPQHVVGRRLHYLERPGRPGQAPLLSNLPKPADPLQFIIDSYPPEEEQV
jgi:hypothetical protein